MKRSTAKQQTPPDSHKPSPGNRGQTAWTEKRGPVIRTYHNVDEISNVVLAANQVARYSHSTPEQQLVILKERIGLILTTYSWGIPPDLLPRLKKKFNSLP